MKIIKSYGEFWRADLIEWEGKKEIIGWATNKSRKANFWDMLGIYALYSNYKLIYIGQSSKQSIGVRLKGHYLKYELKNRWDTFSWYGIRDVLKVNKDKNDMYPLGSVNKRESVSSEKAIEILETLAIRIADPDLNRQRRRFKHKDINAELFHQYVPKKINELNKIIKDLDEKLDKHFKDLQKKVYANTKVLQRQLSSHTKSLQKIKRSI